MKAENVYGATDAAAAAVVCVWKEKIHDDEREMMNQKREIIIHINLIVCSIWKYVGQQCEEEWGKLKIIYVHT